MQVQSPEVLPALDAIDARLRRGESVILFDGVCSLCNGFVDFVISRDSEGRFAFASLQSDEAGRYLARHGRSADSLLDTIVLVDADGIHERSTAVLRIARKLPGVWTLLYGLVVVPAPVRDAVYRVVASNRYRWFGQRDTCRLPTPAERARFV